MARGRGGGRGGGGRSSNGPRKTGIEQYGQDAADEYLKLDDDVWSDGDGGNDDGDEEDVLALKPYDDGEDEEEGNKPKKNKSKKGKGKGKDEDEEDEDLGPASKDWNKYDFYGGDDNGDDSEAASDEDLTFKEARKLEELRSLRLQGSVDPLVALLGPSAGKAEKEEAGKASAEDGSADGVDAAAQFESVFAATAEKSSVRRDLTQLPAAKRKSLLKKEAPELMPLLEDFKAKLASLRPLLPLLSKQAFARLPPSGSNYLQAKASLLLNHLTNLSFYLLLKAEGGDVRAHPVVSQLVWLKELQENLDPLDKQLGLKLKRVAQAAQKIKDEPELQDTPMEETTSKASASTSNGAAAPAEAPKPRASLAERLARLKGVASKGSAAGSGSSFAESSLDKGVSMAELLRLPGRRRRQGGGVGSGDAPADLDEVDPTLGAWMPSMKMSQQISEVQQYLRDRTKRATPDGPDVNPEPRERKARERVQEEVDPRMAAEADRAAARADEDDASEEIGGEEGQVLREAKLKAKAKKEQKAAAQALRDKAKLAQQFHPENAVDGRRGTSKRILENRGLARVRKRKAGNARVSNRNKYETMVKKRKGAVVEMREGAADGATYDGEATGVRTNIKKSVKLA